MGLQSSLAKQFVSPAVWRQSDYDREWSAWIDDTCQLLLSSGRTARGETFAPQEWQILNLIHATAKASRRLNDLIGVRTALARYREAVKHFLGSDNQPQQSSKPPAGQGASK